MKAVLQNWQLPPIDLWAVFPAGRTVTTKARAFIAFVQEVFREKDGSVGLTFAD